MKSHKNNKNQALKKRSLSLRRVFVIALVVVTSLFAVSSMSSVEAATVGNYNDALKMVKKGKFGLAMKEFKQLAEAGHAPSQFSVGLMYHLGRGVSVDLGKAYTWYKKSVFNDHASGINNIGMMYLNGEYVVKNRDVAFRLFKKASTSHAQAMDNLAQCFENGWGTTPDVGRAINMYGLSGENGYLRAWYHLGQLYEKGHRDLPKNMDKAVEWYQKAAALNQQKAIYRLKRLGIEVIPKPVDTAGL